MNLLFEHSRLPPPIQFFQPFSHFMSARFTHIAMLTVRMVDSQKGQQVASQLHELPREFRLLASGGAAFATWGTALRRGENIMPHDTFVGRFERIGRTRAAVVVFGKRSGAGVWESPPHNLAAGSQTTSPLFLAPGFQFRPPCPLRLRDLPAG
jgi:hypothetical protein